MGNPHPLSSGERCPPAAGGRPTELALDDSLHGICRRDEDGTGFRAHARHHYLHPGVCRVLRARDGHRHAGPYLKADRTPRIFGTGLGLAGFTLACLRNHPASHQQPTHLLVELVVPLAGAGLAFAVNVAGEALATWFPAPERDGNQARRTRRFRDRPGYSSASA